MHISRHKTWQKFSNLIFLHVPNYDFHHCYWKLLKSWHVLQMELVRLPLLDVLGQSTTPTVWYVWTNSLTLFSTSVVTCAFVMAVGDNSCPEGLTARYVEHQSKTSLGPTGATLTEVMSRCKIWTKDSKLKCSLPHLCGTYSHS